MSSVLWHFQASAGDPGIYSLWIRRAYCIVNFLRPSAMSNTPALPAFPHLRLTAVSSSELIIPSSSQGTLNATWLLSLVAFSSLMSVAAFDISPFSLLKLPPLNLLLLSRLASYFS